MADKLAGRIDDLGGAPRWPRRRFLAMAGSTVAGTVLFAACGGDDEDEAALSTTPSASTPESTATSPATGTATGATGGATETPSGASSEEQGTVLVSDVLDHRLASEDWSGDFGWVRFRLHHALVDGEDAYYIRTDASDQAFASEQGLVHVPLLANALAAGAGFGAIYLREDEEPAVLSAAPHLESYSPAYRVHWVRGDAADLTGEAAILAAAEAGEIELEQTDIVVNYPVVKWPGGEMPVDEELTAYLGGGQLVEPVDVEAMTVTFKLHACYPNSRYIVTDVTMPPMAEGMRIAPAPGAAPLTDAGATAKILVFGNGLEGSGPMGFQKSVTDTVAGEPAWSPFWDHYTHVWSEAAEPQVLRSHEEITAAVERGDLEQYSGTPDTHPTLFMVNCPVPVIAPLA